MKHDDRYQIFHSNIHIQEKEKKTFANMFDKFAMADKKKEALERQVCQLEWSDDCQKHSIFPVEAGCNEPYRSVELRRGGQHQHRPQQYQGRNFGWRNMLQPALQVGGDIQMSLDINEAIKEDIQVSAITSKGTFRDFIPLWHTSPQFNTYTGDRGKWRWLGWELRTFP